MPKTIQQALSQKNYSAWRINPDDFPSKGSAYDQILFLINYAILAPSTHNSQPWLFKIRDNKIDIIPDYSISKKLQEVDPNLRQLAISTGCCISNICLAAEAFNMKFKKSYLSDNKRKKFVQIEFTKSKAGNIDHSVLRAMTSRLSDKGFYKKNKKLPSNFLTDATFGNSRVVFSSKAKIDSYANLYIAATKKIISRRFTKELMAWLRPSNSVSEDGMPAFTLGLNQLQYRVGRQVFVRFPALFRKVTYKDADKIRSSSAVGLIVTDKDEFNDWIMAGEDFEQLAVDCYKRGLHITIMQALIENKLTRKKLLSDKPAHPQIFFRVGYPQKNSTGLHSPRKSINSFIID